MFTTEQLVTTSETITGGFSCDLPQTQHPFYANLPTLNAGKNGNPQPSKAAPIPCPTPPPPSAKSTTQQNKPIQFKQCKRPTEISYTLPKVD